MSVTGQPRLDVDMLRKRAQNLRDDLHTAAVCADEDGDDLASVLWEAYSQAGDVVEDLTL